MTALVRTDSETLLSILEETWTSFVEADSVLLPLIDPPDHYDWTAAVEVDGAWTAVILLSVDHAVARAVTAAMLAVPEPEVVEDDMPDALGELVNVVGGAVKSLMPGPSSLGLPLVARGRLSVAAAPVEAGRAEILWSGQPVRVVVRVPFTEPEEAVS